MPSKKTSGIRRIYIVAPLSPRSLPLVRSGTLVDSGSSMGPKLPERHKRNAETEARINASNLTNDSPRLYCFVQTLAGNVILRAPHALLTSRERRSLHNPQTRSLSRATRRQLSSSAPSTSDNPCNSPGCFSERNPLHDSCREISDAEVWQQPVAYSIAEYASVQKSLYTFGGSMSDISLTRQ
jgi:hypothetical protein